MEEEVDLINVDVASGFNYHVISVIQWIRKTYPNLAKKKFRPDGTPEVRLINNPEL